MKMLSKLIANILIMVVPERYLSQLLNNQIIGEENEA